MTTAQLHLVLLSKTSLSLPPATEIVTSLETLKLPKSSSITHSISLLRSIGRYVPSEYLKKDTKLALADMALGLDVILSSGKVKGEWKEERRSLRGFVLGAGAEGSSVSCFVVGIRVVRRIRKRLTWVDWHDVDGNDQVGTDFVGDDEWRRCCFDEGHH